MIKMYTVSRTPLRRLSFATAALALLCMFCLPTATARAATQNPASIRIIHASPDIGIVDAFVDRQKLLSSFEFGTVTDYVALPAGSHTLQIALIGKGVNASLVTQTMTVNAGSAYTVAALGTNASGFSFSVFQDNNMVAGNGAKIRVYHLSPFAGTVNVEADTKTIIQGISYPQASSYIGVPAGSYTFDLTGVAQYAPSPISTEVKPWTVTSIFAIGPSKGNTQIRFVSTQIAGMPGMPQTGSDPTPVASQLSSLPGIAMGGTMIILCLIGYVGLAGKYRRHRAG